MTASLASIFFAPGLLMCTTTDSGAQGVELYISPAPPPATVGQPYSYQLQVVGGVAPYTFTIYDHAIDPYVPGPPAGLSITPSGLIHGTPVIAERSEFEYNVSDSAGDSSGGRYLSMTVSSGNPTLDQTLIPEDTDALVLENATQTTLTDEVESAVSLIEATPGYLECVVSQESTRYCFF